MIHDPRSNSENTEAVAGAEHIHIHHRTSDMSATARGSKPGSALCAEVVCHGCHKSAIFFFRMDMAKEPPEAHRARELHEARDAFCREHRSCRGERGVDYREACDARREGTPKVVDLAGALG